MTVFWDTNLFIYLIEQHPDFHDKVLALYDRHRSSGEEIATSTLTLGELLAQPLRCGRSDLAQEYLTLLTQPGTIQLVPFDLAAAESYAKIRAATDLRQPDAIQLACAAAHQVSAFITNDRQLHGLTVPGIPVIHGL